MVCCSLGASAVLADVLIPPGYELIQITNTPYKERVPALNNRGQIVFEGQIGGGWDGAELFLYDTDGSLTQLTNDNVWDGLPDIADDGTIVWSKAIGDGGTEEIMIRSPSGEVTRLTFNDLDDSSPHINNVGQIAWKRITRLGCANSSSDVMFFDGQTIRRITKNLWSNQTTVLNDHGEIVWTEYDHCAGGASWISLIKLYSNGVITTLSEPGLQSQVATINNNGVCAWQFRNPVTFEEGIHLWDNGVRTLFTDRGNNPNLNDRGDMLFLRQHAGIGWQAHLFLNGQFRQLTDDPFPNTNGEINNRGEVAWRSGPTNSSDIRFLRRLPTGDLNCDGAFNGGDIDPFFLALGDPAAYQIAYPDCNLRNGDMNCDETLNGADIDPFFDCLAGMNCPQIALSRQPKGQDLCVGNALTLSVDGSGFNLDIQWRKDGKPIAGATQRTFSIGAVTAQDAGTYEALITNPCSAVVSDPARITVAELIFTHPVSQTVCESAPVLFSVTAIGQTLTYQWRKDGVDIPGATSNLFIIPATQLSDAGVYDVVVTSSQCAQISEAATLTVQQCP